MALLKKSERLVRKNMPCIPLRDLVIYPHMVVPLLVGRQRSLNAVEEALSSDSYLTICFQKDPQIEEPGIDDIFSVGVVTKILQSAREPNGVMRILVECLERVRFNEIVANKKYFCCNADVVKPAATKDREAEALSRVALEIFDKYLKLNPALPRELYGTVVTIEDFSKLCDTIAGYLPLKLKDKGLVLETIPIKDRFRVLSEVLNAEIGVLEVQKEIQDKVLKRVEDNQKQYLLNEQLKTIQKELGRDEEGTEIQQLREKVKKAQMPKPAEDKATEELNRLSKMMPMSPEATVSRTYIDWLIGLPWNEKTEDILDVTHARQILDEDHYGLEKVKDRIVEYLAVRKRTGSLRGPIICFVGPPGVGKTSLGRSIARAMGRKFVRISLGGMRDEAEIRGHRRTYIGALPGRIIQSLKKVNVANPVFLLDEIDKLGKDFRGDPASALLEVLDPEQNATFSDHYLEVEFDLSKVLFITTANTEFTIPPPLLDRMELIPLVGYTMWEKLEITNRFLLPKQMKENGLAPANLNISDETVQRIVRNFTREAGVRNLEREIATICRKVTKKIVESGNEEPTAVLPADLEKYLGQEKFSTQMKNKEKKIGVATGMAWTEYGGDIIFTEVVTMRGKGELILTGQLGDVMKESARAALTYVRSNAEALHIDPAFYSEYDIHVHVPEGAIPKDGPSAGVTIATALASCLSRTPADSNIAMTGEINLQGQVLKIGGLKSKILAAHRSGIRKVIIPKENERDLDEIPKQVKDEMEVITVETVDEVLNQALLK